MPFRNRAILILALLPVVAWAFTALPGAAQTAADYPYSGNPPPPYALPNPGEHLFSAPGMEFDQTQSSDFVDADQFLVEPGPSVIAPEIWRWQLAPDGLIYHPYAAGVHESRISGVVLSDKEGTPIFDVALGGHVGVFRFGTSNDDWPSGWQIDIEGAAFPRLNFDANWDLELTDFRFGVPLTYGAGPWRYKFGYYHLSSHLGDEYAIRNPGSLASRINYSRDSWDLGVSYFPNLALRLYGDVSWAFHTDGGNEPWEFQFGADYSQPGRTGFCGTPFFAVNAHIREAVDFGGNFVAQLGWLWRGDSGRTMRIGAHYYNGKSNQFEFFDRFEEQIGLGLWYDQ